MTAERQLTRLIEIMARLRDPATGCEWDRAQTFATIAPYTLEEAYEVADAVVRGDLGDLRDELGDLLLQVVFHARMAEETGVFAFRDVAKAISDKLEQRHPHIFGGELLDDQHRDERWEAIKASERATKGATSSMDGVAMALPALMRAQKLQKRAARDGFDWQDPSGPEAKILEEIEELHSAPPESREEEAGDLLFAVVNFLRAYGIDAESALRTANRKFERRYRAMETLAAASGSSFADRDIVAQENLWQAVKRSEAG